LVDDIEELVEYFCSYVLRESQIFWRRLEVVLLLVYPDKLGVHILVDEKAQVICDITSHEQSVL
jgi:hypothetical protein